MPKILESRNVKIAGRIITLDRVRRIASVVWERYKAMEAEEKHCRIVFRAACFDDSDFESADIDIFSDDSVLVSKRVSEVTIRYSAYEDDETIDISLAHGSYEHRNYVRVSGTDSAWVNGVVKKIEDEIAAFQPQNRFLVEYRGALHIVFALSIGSIYFFLIDSIPSNPVESEPPAWLKELATNIKNSVLLGYGIKYAFSYLVGIWPALFLMDKLESLWPSIEFQIGPEHTFIEKKRRLWISSAILLGVIPVVTSIVYDLVKLAVSGSG